MFYEGTVRRVSDLLREKDERIQPIPPINGHAPNPATPSYLLWMIGQISAMDTKDEKQVARAGRWIGWVLAHLEILGYLENEESRELVRRDVARSMDVVH